MTINFEIKPPEMPDFIYIKQSPGLRQDGFKPNMGSVSVRDLTEEQAVEYSEIMKQEFLHHWKSKQL